MTVCRGYPLEDNLGRQFDMTNDIKNQDRKYRPLVYVASAYSGDVTTNSEKAKEYCRFALEQGQIPLAPHLMIEDLERFFPSDWFAALTTIDGELLLRKL